MFSISFTTASHVFLSLDRRSTCSPCVNACTSRAARIMSLARSSSDLTDHLQITLDRLPGISIGSVEIFEVMHIDLTAEKICEGLDDAHVRFETDFLSRKQFDQDIDVAVRSKILARNRAE